MGWVKGTDFKDLVYYEYDDKNIDNDEAIAKIYDDNKARIRYRNEDKFTFKENKGNTRVIDHNMETMSFTSLNKILLAFRIKEYTVIINNLEIQSQEIDEKVGWYFIHFTGNTEINFITFKQEVDLRFIRFLGSFTFNSNNVADRMTFSANSFSECFYFLDNDIKNLYLRNLGFTNQQGKILTNSVQVFEYYSQNITMFNPILFRQTCNYIKNHFIQQNNFIDSNSFYALEMLARGKELETNGSKLEKLVFNINEEISNHGQSIGLPIFHILMISLVWGVSDIFLLKSLSFNMSYFINIAFPIKDLSEDTNLLLALSKVFSAVLWWQLIRAIRKDIKR